MIILLCDVNATGEIKKIKKNVSCMTTKPIY